MGEFQLWIHKDSGRYVFARPTWLGNYWEVDDDIEHDDYYYQPTRYLTSTFMELYNPVYL